MHRKISELERVMYAVCISPLIIRSAFLLALRTLKAAGNARRRRKSMAVPAATLPATAIKLGV